MHDYEGSYDMNESLCKIVQMGYVYPDREHRCYTYIVN